MSYCMIENVGECPIDGFTTFGISTTRFGGNAKTIGQFGTGLKHAIMTFLRMGIDVVAFSGKTCVKYFTEPHTVNDGLITHTYKQLYVSINGKKEKMSVVLEHGALDWNEIDMAMREVVANAIDRTERENKPIDTITIDKSGAGQVIGKTGHTRIFVKLKDSVKEYVEDLPRRFLHFCGKSDEAVLDNETNEQVRFYKKGVFVRSLDTTSLFHYNIRSLHIDESRNSDDFSCRSAAGSAILNRTSKDQLVKLFLYMIEGKECFESKIGEYTLYLDNDKENIKRVVSAWNEASDNAVLCCSDNPRITQMVEGKGYHIACLPRVYYKILRELDGITSDINYVDSEKDETFPPNDAMIAAVDKAWGTCGIVGYNNKSKPDVLAFKPIMQAESQKFGQYVKGKVLLHHELAGKILYKVALEEVVHHITGATDMSRDFQDYLLRVITEASY